MAKNKGWRPGWYLVKGQEGQPRRQYYDGEKWTMWIISPITPDQINLEDEIRRVRWAIAGLGCWSSSARSSHFLHGW